MPKQFMRSRTISNIIVRLQWEAHCEEDSMQDGALLIYLSRKLSGRLNLTTRPKQFMRDPLRFKCR